MATSSDRLRRESALLLCRNFAFIDLDLASTSGHETQSFWITIFCEFVDLDLASALGHEIR